MQNKACGSVKRGAHLGPEAVDEAGGDERGAAVLGGAAGPRLPRRQAPPQGLHHVRVQPDVHQPPAPPPQHIWGTRGGACFLATRGGCSAAPADVSCLTAGFLGKCVHIAFSLIESD